MDCPQLCQRLRRTLLSNPYLRTTRRTVLGLRRILCTVPTISGHSDNRGSCPGSACTLRLPRPTRCPCPIRFPVSDSDNSRCVRRQRRRTFPKQGYLPTHCLISRYFSLGFTFFPRLTENFAATHSPFPIYVCAAPAFPLPFLDILSAMALHDAVPPPYVTRTSSARNIDLLHISGSVLLFSHFFRVMLHSLFSRHIKTSNRSSYPTTGGFFFNVYFFWS